MRSKYCSILVVGLSSLASPLVLSVAPVTKAFTYQGRLTDGGTPANGPYDFKFRLFDDPAAGTQAGLTQGADDLAVTNGLFIAQINFGYVFDGAAHWLEISVRPGASSGAYTTLLPRQQLTAAPYASGLSLPVTETVSLFDITGSAFHLTNTGTSSAAKFEIDNPANANAALYAATSGSGPAAHANGLLQVGSNPGKSGELKLFRKGSANPAAQANADDSGGNLDLFDDEGNRTLRMQCIGTGGAVSINRNVGPIGISLNGNFFGTNQPWVNIAGSARSATFNMGASGNASVTLPVDAVASSVNSPP